MAAVFGAVVFASAQSPVIDSFGSNGYLVCTNLIPGGMTTIEWAPAITGPWTNTWAPLEGVAADAKGTIQVRVPMFYRVRVATPQGMVWIEPGTFTMGSPDTEPGRSSVEGPETMVTLTKSFWMAKYEVTQREYLAVMKRNPSYSTGDLDRPVERVYWNDAFIYCMTLTRMGTSGNYVPTGMRFAFLVVL